jgi:hypothetical protein
MSDLLPCPFCGGAGRVSWSRDRDIVNIRCELWPRECLGAGPNCWEEPAAIAAWNRRASGWNPISTAPRDGTEIWAYNGEQVRMRWEDGDPWSGWLYGDETLNDIDPDPEQPTHWQPLPPAPEPTP